MKRIIIIGAGASGLMAAITAARYGAAVTILEGMEKPGKKILVTGNGRCNLTNREQTKSDRYRSNTEKFPNMVLDQFTAEESVRFFEEIGLLTQDKDGYIYPYVNQASAVLDVLLLEARKQGVKIKCSEKVRKLEEKDDASGWKVFTESWCYESDAVILAAGSKAAPQTGSDGSGYTLAKMIGHHIIDPHEALVPLKTKEKWVKKISGVRMPAKVTLVIENTDNNISHYSECGELQWTDYGISGIVVFQLSRYAVNALAFGHKVSAVLDLMPDYLPNELDNLLRNRMRFGSMEEFLTGVLPKKVIPVILELCGIKTSLKATDISEKQILYIARMIKELNVTIIGNKSFESAQVCSGGVDCNQINPQTMESKKKKGLYFSGELLDVDGICGGYNLQWAWSSGYVAGRSAAMKE